MKRLKVTIKEKEKKISSFNLYNFREEVVNFMYKKTVAESSRNNLVFYVLLFFLSIKKEEKTLLEELLEKNIPKINILNTKLSQFERLERGQYAQLVDDSNLREVFQYDVFFTLIVAFRNYEEIIGEFEDFFEDNKPLAEEYQRLNQLYGKGLLDFFNRFEKNLIEDDRVGYTGESLDLSKSVYRTIQMRSSRRIDLTLHKYAEVKNISSQSPIIVEVIQHIDPQIVVNIWDAYNLGDYVRGTWQLTGDYLKDKWFLQALLGNAGWDAGKWLRWKLINGAKNKKEKDVARNDFKEALEHKRQEEGSDHIQNALAKSVMSSNEYLLNEVQQLRLDLARVTKENDILVNKDKRIKELEDRIEKLENIEVDVEELDE